MSAKKSFAILLLIILIAGIYSTAWSDECKIIYVNVNATGDNNGTS